jgi:hypothetical protein
VMSRCQVMRRTRPPRPRRRRAHEGIQVRHSRRCPANTRGPCACSPSSRRRSGRRARAPVVDETPSCGRSSYLSRGRLNCEYASKENL